MVVYFSGHGAQFQGENYLFPVDFNTQYEDELPVEAISTSFIMDKLRSNFNGLNIVILDACRDNPLQKKNKSGAKGLARINNAPPNTYTIFATGPGKVASDNPHGNNGLFTKYLVQHMKQPGLSLGDMVLETRKNVMAASSNRQVPYESGALTQRFCFAGCDNSTQVTTSVAVAPVAIRPAPAVNRPSNSTHSHNGRSHSHPLPAQGVNHQHGGAPKPEPTRDYREPEMVFIKGGTFQMGSPSNEAGRRYNEKQHLVTVGNFQLGKTEVTVGEFKRFVQAANYRTTNGCHVIVDNEWKLDTDKNWKNPGFSQTDQHPVVCVTQQDALAYAQWLSQRTGKHYGLPTEAQWEYAARAGTQTARYWGDNTGQACQHGNVVDQKIKQQYAGWNWAIHNCNDGSVHTATVGRYRANRFGLKDMLGNVSEWTCSAYESNYNGSEHRCAPNNGVVRGGSWYGTPVKVRSAYRTQYSVTNGGSFVGFRLSRTP